MQYWKPEDDIPVDEGYDTLQKLWHAFPYIWIAALIILTLVIAPAQYRHQQEVMKKNHCQYIAWRVVACNLKP